MTDINVEYKGNSVVTITDEEQLDLAYELKVNGDENDLSSIKGWLKHITDVYMPSKEESSSNWTEADSMKTIYRFVKGKIKASQTAMLKDSKKNLLDENIDIPVSELDKKELRTLIRTKVWYKNRNDREAEGNTP